MTCTYRSMDDSKAAALPGVSSRKSTILQKAAPLGLLLLCNRQFCWSEYLLSLADIFSYINFGGGGACVI